MTINYESLNFQHKLHQNFLTFPSRSFTCVHPWKSITREIITWVRYTTKNIFELEPSWEPKFLTSSFFVFQSPFSQTQAWTQHITCFSTDAVSRDQINHFGTVERCHRATPTKTRVVRAREARIRKSYTHGPAMPRVWIFPKVSASRSERTRPLNTWCCKFITCTALKKAKLTTLEFSFT